MDRPPVAGSSSAAVKARLTALTGTCKQHAAVNKTAGDRSQAPITAEGIEKIAARHPLAVARPEDSSSKLVLLYTMFKETKDPGLLRAMIRIIDDDGPGLRYDHNTSTEGVMTFFNFDNPLSAEHAAQVAMELKTAFPGMKELDPGLIQKVHEMLCETPANSDTKLGQGLPYGALGYFLDFCQDNIASPDRDEDVIRMQVESALKESKRHNFWGSYPYTWTLPIALKNNNEQRLSEADSHLMLTCAMGVIKSMRKSMENGAASIVEAHGGVLRHPSMQDLVAKLSSTIDVTAMQSLVEQVGAVQAVLFASKFREATDNLRDLEELFTPALRLAQDHQQRDNEEE